MVKLVILSTGSDYTKIIKFCKFFRIDYVIKTEKLTDLELLDECTIYITADLCPDIRLLEYVFDKESVLTGVEYYNLGYGWLPSFCAVLFEGISLHSIPSSIKMDDSIVSGDPEITIPDLYSLRVRCSTLDAIYRKYYFANNVHCNLMAKFIMHLFIETYQQLYLKYDISAHLEETRDQSRFASYIDRKYIGSRTLQQVKNKISKTRITMNDCYNESIQGYLIDVDMPPDKLKNSALGLPGVYKIRAIRDELSINYDITLVGFYYNFNLVGRHPENYMASLKLWLKLKYPIVFCATSETIDKLKNDRNTDIQYYERTLQDWPDLEKYKEHLTPRADRYYYDQTIYRLGTSIKLWSMELAIKNNHFGSSVFVWFDPGFYKNDKLVCHELMEETRIFDYLEIPKDKIIITSYLTNVGLNPDEVKRNVNTILSWLIVGYKEPWLKLIERYREAYTEETDRCEFHTEQVLLGKLYHKFPEMFEIREYGLHHSYFSKILNFP